MTTARTATEWQLRETAPELRERYLHDGNSAKGKRSVTFTPTLPAAGNYEVFLYYPSDENRATNVPVTVATARARFFPIPS